MGCVKITLLATYAFNAIMSLSRASTRGSYSRIEGVTYRPSGSTARGGETTVSCYRGQIQHYRPAKFKNIPTKL